MSEFHADMRINSINTYTTRPSFERKLREDEKPEYKKAVHQALDYLDVKNVAMIVHGSSFPAVNRDSNIGSPYSKGADKFVDFLDLHGFNSVQLGPGGSIAKGDSSPYLSKVFAKNDLFIDLEKLKSDEYANILSDKTYKETTKEIKSNGKNYSYTNFYEAFANYDVALDEAYGNFDKKVKAKDEKALKLNEEFNQFKMKNQNWLEADGLYKVLSNYYGNDNFEKWENKTDKNLIEGIKTKDKKSLQRYEQLKNRSGKDIDKNSFAQFIADKQVKENTKTRKEKSFKYIGDVLVGFAKSDVWANKAAFLNDWKLGCPYGGAGNGPQAWGIPVLDPKKLFNKDGSLGESGKVLKEKVAYQLENFDNVRVDHALGLVDPYVYKPESIEKDADGVINRDKLVGNNVSYLKNIDPDSNFKKVLEKIILPTFEEYGVDKKEAVWEDLGCNTPTFDKVYYQEQKLPGITQTEWKRVENAPRDNWGLVGSHDCRPAVQMDKNNDAWNVDYLSGFLNADPNHGKERQEYKEKISKNPVERVKAKFTELFRGTKNIQIMFADFLGINQVYNYGGQDKPTNWKLRVNNDFEDTYHKELEKENSTVLNMPELLSQAVRAKNDMTVAKANDKSKYEGDKVRTELENETKPLLEELDKFKEILKEKSV